VYLVPFIIPDNFTIAGHVQIEAGQTSIFREFFEKGAKIIWYDPDPDLKEYLQILNTDERY